MPEVRIVQADEGRYVNRELSRLDYDARVLSRAEDESLPLLERLRFLTIFSRNLDDFFQVRVAGLKEQVEAAAAPTVLGDPSPAEQLQSIRKRVEGLVQRQRRLYHDRLRPALAEAGIEIIDAGDLNKAEREFVATYYVERVFPVLTPLAVDPGHPFPYISHLSLNLAVMVRDPLRRQKRFARVKVPPLLPGLVPLPGAGRFIPLEQVIALNLQSLFTGMEVVSQHHFRVTRDNDLDLADSEAEDLIATVQTELLRQRRGAFAVRLEVSPDMPAGVENLLVRELELSPADVYRVEGPLELGALEALLDIDRPDLKVAPWFGVAPPELRAGGERADLFEVLRERDVLVQHPYDSFSSSVEAFIEQAAGDPQVLAIKLTMYRTSGPASPIPMALSRAADAGKQVVALVELKARGDEQANIGWAQMLEKSGVHVVYGLVGLKTHAKTALVVRQEGSRVRRYVHVATGNYNPRTAQAYEDIGLLSADPELGADVSELFNFLTGYSKQRKYRSLLVAPMNLRRGLLKLIRKEASRQHGRIVMKVNNLVDQQIIDALYDASRAGTQVDLIVRSICCLRPEVPGLSENIRVRSIVGRILEHSRIFCFGSERRGCSYYIGSADVMERNLDRRVEAVVPVRDPELCQRLNEVIESALADDRLAWTMLPDGTWRPPAKGIGPSSQERLMQLALERARGARGK
jgi:polyphosphate kinase